MTLSEALAETHRAAFPAHEAWSAAAFDQLLATGAAVLVGNPDAFLVGRITLDEAEILTLATNPAIRRKGHGRAVLTGFLGLAAASGAATVFLEVSEMNVAARALYLGAGFARAGSRRAYYRSPDGRHADALILRRDLRP